jgi:Caspase domain
VRVPQFIAVTWLALICALAPANAEKRIALVVGNGAYRHADRLTNPVNDARGMRDALTKLGFDVTYGENLDQKALRRTVGDFARAVGGAAVAVVYFAGHGATFGDTPYVVPIDAEFSSLEQAPYDLVPVETLIGELRRVDGVRIAILDACRDNAAERELKKQASRGGEASRGLAPMKNPDGLILAYATQYLSTAADGGGANSPFTAALLHNIATPGLDVKDLFFKVGQEVVAATGRKQRPEISISMYEPYALVPAAKPDALSGAAAAVLKPADGRQTVEILQFDYTQSSAGYVRNATGTVSDPVGFAAALAQLQPPRGAHGGYGLLGDDNLLGGKPGYGLRQLGAAARRYITFDRLYVVQPPGFESAGVQSGTFNNADHLNDTTLGWVLFDLRSRFEADLKPFIRPSRTGGVFRLRDGRSAAGGRGRRQGHSRPLQGGWCHQHRSRRPRRHGRSRSRSVAGGPGQL